MSQKHRVKNMSESDFLPHIFDPIVLTIPLFVPCVPFFCDFCASSRPFYKSLSLFAAKILITDYADGMNLDEFIRAIREIRGLSSTMISRKLWPLCSVAILL